MSWAITLTIGVKRCITVNCYIIDGIRTGTDHLFDDVKGPRTLTLCLIQDMAPPKSRRNKNKIICDQTRKIEILPLIYG